MLIEDDAATVETIRLCTQIYYPESEVVSSSQGLAAIEMLKKDKFDVVLVDLGLPYIDGLEVLKRIRVFSKIPAIIISARHSFNAASVADELGAIDYITKPFDFHILIQRLGDATGQTSIAL